MKLPIPKTIRLSKVLPKLREYCVNYFSQGGNLIPRPGVESVDTETGACRGVFTYADNLYVVYGTTLFRSVSGVLTSVGTVLGTQPVRIAKGFAHAAICAGETSYILTAPSTLVAITDPDLPACIDVERVNGYYVWCPSDGGPLLYSAVGDASTIGPLDYFDAEVLPDKNTGVINFRNDLFALGEDSIERFRQIGSASAPFIRVEGGSIPVGYLGGKVASKDDFLFLGRDQEQGPGFFASEGRISTPAIDEILEEYTYSALQDCEAMRFQWRGSDLYVFSLANHSFCFTAGSWSFFSSEIDQQTVTPWDYVYCAYHDGDYYVGKTGSLGKLTSANTDEGSQVQRIVNTFARSAEKLSFSVDNILLEVGQGLSDGGSIGLSLSRDGKTWGDRFFIDLAPQGNYQQEVEWRYPGGLGCFDGYMGIEIYTTSDATVAVDNAVIGL